MAKQPSKQTLHSWAIYWIAKKQQLVGIIDGQPDEALAIEAAIEQFQIPVC